MIPWTLVKRKILFKTVATGEGDRSQLLRDQGTWGSTANS